MVDDTVSRRPGRPGRSGRAQKISALPVALTVVNGVIAYGAANPSGRTAAAQAQGVTWARHPDPDHMCGHC